MCCRAPFSWLTQAGASAGVSVRSRPSPRVGRGGDVGWTNTGGPSRALKQFLVHNVEIRRPKSEGRRKSEIRRPENPGEGFLTFGFRASAFLWISAFGFRI